MKKNISIELMRFLMMISIAVLHFGEDFSGMSRTLKGGAIGVDSFFILQGCFWLDIIILVIIIQPLLRSKQISISFLE